MKHRNSNVELLRIVAMILITAHHFAIWGFFKQVHVGTINLNILWLQFLESLGKIGVDIFMLITGYFSFQTVPNSKKFFQITNNVRLYAVFSFLVLVVVGEIKFNSILLVKSFFPLLAGMYWFIIAYVIIYSFSDFLSQLFISLSKKQALNLLKLNILFFLILPTFFNSWSSTVTDLVPVLFVGFYIKRFGISEINQKKLSRYTYAIVILLFMGTLLSDLTGAYLKIPRLISSVGTHFLTSAHSPFVLLISLYIFCKVISFDEKYNARINWLSGSAVAIYLIQDYGPTREVLWGKILRVKEMSETLNFVEFLIYSIVSIFLVVLFAIFVDKILKLVLQKPLNKLLDLELKTYTFLIRL